MQKLEEYKVSLKELLAAGVHFGHQAKRWNPKMSEYIYAKREGIHIFDLEITAAKLEEAMTMVREIAASGKKIIFVGTKRQASAIVKEEAIKCGAPYVAVRWLGGILTNWEQMKQSVENMREYEDRKAKGEFKKYTKRENVLRLKAIERSRRFLGGLLDLRDEPGALFIVDTKKEEPAVKEAIKKGIPVIGIVDSNADPDVVDYPVPGNDDAVASIKFLVSKIAQAYSDGLNVLNKVSKAEPEKKKVAEKKTKKSKSRTTKGAGQGK